jgi:hypothetical protein
MPQAQDSIKTSNIDDDDKHHKMNKVASARPQNSNVTLIAFAVVAIISVVTIPTPFQPVGKPSLLHVWYYGWITALSTGLGVLPLVFAPNMDKYWVGISNGTFREMFHTDVSCSCSCSC